VPEWSWTDLSSPSFGMQKSSSEAIGARVLSIIGTSMRFHALGQTLIVSRCMKTHGSTDDWQNSCANSLAEMTAYWSWAMHKIWHAAMPDNSPCLPITWKFTLSAQLLQ